MNVGRRGSTKIVAEVIEGARGGSLKTRIIRAANLNHVRGTEYLDHCLEVGLLAREDGRYVPTEKGKRLLEHWQEVEERLHASEG